jgi:hypothetical protein
MRQAPDKNGGEIRSSTPFLKKYEILKVIRKIYIKKLYNEILKTIRRFYGRITSRIRYTKTDEEDKKNKDVSKHIVEVYNDDGTRRDKSEIAEDVIKLIK